MLLFRRIEHHPKEMFLRELPETACPKDTSSGSFDLRSSRLRRHPRDAQDDKAGGSGMDGLPLRNSMFR
jgi:hypothetical protein